MVDDSQTEWVNAFRTKSTYMKTWKPSSTPSNRDRLELYALHKQSVQGDAPSNLPSSVTASPADQAKYQAWRRKSGLSQPEAMKLYCHEADRQIRVYGVGTAALATSNGTTTTNGSSNGIVPPTPGTMAAHRQQQTFDSNMERQPRGLAAIPLLCAAASESRHAYLRRLAQTPTTSAWWKRQEPLTATPGTWGSALVEQVLLGLAAFFEHLSLLVNSNGDPNADNAAIASLPAAVIQSFLWPWHNSFLCLWMALILVAVATQSALELVQTVVWGSRRSGWTLEAVWKDHVVATARSIQSLTQAHQPVSARLIGLGLWPAAAVILHVVDAYLPTVLTKSVVYCLLFLAGWWYWFLVLPVAAFWWLFWAGVAGGCFALIELAGV